MAAIRVETFVQGLADGRAEHEVHIDGERRGTVPGGAAKIFEVQPGIHTVSLRLPGHESAAVKLVVGFGTTDVQCETRGRRWLGLFPLEGETQIRVREEHTGLPQPQEVQRPRGLTADRSARLLAVCAE